MHPSYLPHTLAVLSALGSLTALASDRQAAPAPATSLSPAAIVCPICAEAESCTATASRQMLWENAHVIAWVTTFPAKSTLPWHRHEADRIVICGEDGSLTKTASTGETTYLHFTANRPTWHNACLPDTLHTDFNEAATPLHFTLIQFKPGALSVPHPSFAHENAEKSSVLENAYVVIKEYTLAANSATPPHRTPFDRIIIADRDCTLTQKYANGQETALPLKAHIPQWLMADPEGALYSTANEADTPIKLTGILFKSGALRETPPEMAASPLGFQKPEDSPVFLK